MSSPVYSKPPAPTSADTDKENIDQIVNILVDKIAKLTKALPVPTNLAAQLQQWNQRIVILYGDTAPGKAQVAIRAEVKNALDARAGGLRKAAQDAQDPAHAERATNYRPGKAHPALKAEAAGHVANLEVEAQKQPAAAQPAYQATIRQLKQEIDAYDGYAAWIALP
jgi:hypothetical protein